MTTTWSVYTRILNSRDARKAGKALRDADYDISNADVVGKTPQAIAEYFYPFQDETSFARRSEVLQLICEAAEWLPRKAETQE